MKLVDKIRNKEVCCAIIGLGYVGLPLAMEFAGAGVEVVGIDIDPAKIASLKKGHSYVQDVPSEKLKGLLERGLFSATTSYEVLKKADTVNICVPTPLRKTKEPDISFIVAATRHIARYLRRGQLVILESTTYPGTTEEVLLPLFEERGLKAGRDFYLAFSPERVDPGNPSYNTKNIPKVVGGVTAACTEAACALYQLAIDTVHPVSSTRVAETVKLLENTFRAVNIGLVNELAQMCDKMKIDVWEVIEAAKTKPFGFMAFYPGPGLGGHCIPIDPFYLSWKARLFGFEARFIELAGQVNGSMPEYVVRKTADALNARRRSLRGANILVLGAAYKKNVGDWRESPAVEIIHLLKEKGARVLYHDPHVPVMDDGRMRMRSVALTRAVLRKSSCIVLVTDHADYPYEEILRHARLIIDTRHAFKIKKQNVVKL